ncbi:MAG: DNA-binding transcriptional LysR family regulator [Cognaticolwellia sp.]|jgi:DNA-binding transcriptional LysR family regulator
MDLNSLRIFATVAEHQSFSKAAEKLGLPVSTVSRRVSALEADLGVLLLERTTRQVRLSGAGNTLLQNCKPHLDALVSAKDLLQSERQDPQGRLRVALPTGLSDYAIGDVAVEYMRRFPKVQLEIIATDERVVPDGQELHLALRAGWGDQNDAALMQRLLAPIPMQLVASPAYVAEHPTIAHPSDLLQHGCVVVGHTPASANIELTHTVSNETERLKVPIRLFTTSLGMCSRVTLDGLGVAGLPSVSCRKYLEDGSLVELIPEWTLLESPLTIYFPNEKTPPFRVRVFMDLLIARLERNNKG